jgi:ubiquinone/menaquinone biosynthesis C-methylase UbiE
VIRRLALLAGFAIAAGAYWARKNPSACPYGQRWMIEIPHPLITRARLRDALAPSPGERMLEIGPGTGYYTAEIAEWIGAAGKLEIFDIQQEMLDHTMRRMDGHGIANVTATHGDARELPYEDASFDATILITVLGEIPDQDAALREIARVLRPSGRLVVGEMIADPHVVTLGSLTRRAEAAGLHLQRHNGTRLGYFARLEHRP